MSPSSKEQQLLVDRYVASFEKFGELEFYVGLDPVAEQLVTGGPGAYGLSHWRPIKVSTDRSALDRIYSNLPRRFPPLFELLLLSYRWAEVDLQLYRLIANPPGNNLSGFLERMSKDRGLWESLKPAGYMQFGKGPDLDYDPICFDMRSRKKNGDCRIVKIDHEEILCNYRLKIVGELAPSFEELMLRTIDQATQA
jgi:hypothetical protein